MFKTGGGYFGSNLTETVRVLSGHGPFRDHLFRRRLTDSDLCPADLERDTVEHAVFRCKAVPESLKEARMKYRQELSERWSKTGTYSPQYFLT